MKLFITVDSIGIQSGGGVVTRNELEALKSLDEEIIKIDYQDITPTKFNLPDTPFLQDYLALNKISNLDLSKINLCHMYAGPFSNTIKYLKCKGIKTSITYAAHNRTESIKEFQNLGMEYPFNHVRDQKLWLMYSESPKLTDVVIVPSKLSKDFLIQEGVKEEKIKIIPHGIDIFSEDKIRPISDKFDIGFLGNHGPDKGIRYLIESWSQLNYKDSTLVFAGRGTEFLGPFINKYATNGKYHLAGWIQDIGQFYNNISVYVQPSVTEGFGMEIPQAMSFGRPVIVSDGAGASDVVSHGYDGFIFEKRNIKELSDKINWFKNHPKELAEMGERAREKSKEYGWDKIKERYLDLWRSL